MLGEVIEVFASLEACTAPSIIIKRKLSGRDDVPWSVWNWFLYVLKLKFIVSPEMSSSHVEKSSVWKDAALEDKQPHDCYLTHERKKMF